MVRRSIGALVMVTAIQFVSASAQAQLTACSGNCATVSVVGGNVQCGQTVNLQVSYQQAPTDGTAMSGNDDTAALAMTIGLGDTNTPLSLADCNDANTDGLPDAVTVGSSITDDFRVVIENASCANRNRCLCPDTGQGQTRDNFINVVVYGPKTLPPEGTPVEIPRLPDTADLMTIQLRSATGVADGTVIPIPIYSELTGAPAKPQFAANLSIGDQAAVDQTANRGTNTSKVNVQSGSVTVACQGGGCSACVGDCDQNGTVVVGELITGVNIALDTQPLENCTCFDANLNGTVEVGELITGVNNALNECPN